MFKTLEKCKEQEKFFTEQMGYTTLSANDEVGNYILAKVDKRYGDIQLIEINRSQANPIHILFNKEEFDKLEAMLK